jgi:nucleotide-binding universal stress UspA family protein
VQSPGRLADGISALLTALALQSAWSRGFTMFQQILCPVDFSEASRHAIQYAVALARLHRSVLTALHVSPQEPAESRRLATEAAVLFDSATQTGIKVEVLVECGQPAHQILTRAAALPADVIVMGTHGAGGFEHLMLGSVAEKVLRKATCPVFTVPPHAPFTPGATFKKIVCAVDFSEWSLGALDKACILAEESGGAVTAVHVIEWPWHEPPVPQLEGLPPEQAAALLEYRRYQETMAKCRLDAVTKDVGGGRCRIQTRVAHGKPYAELLCAVERERADLVVMGVHSRSALDVFFFGSTTHQIVRRAPCPVLTLRH